MDEAALRRLIEAARREGRLDDVRTLTMKMRYLQMMHTALTL